MNSSATRGGTYILREYAYARTWGQNGGGLTFDITMGLISKEIYTVLRFNSWLL